MVLLLHLLFNDRRISTAGIQRSLNFGGKEVKARRSLTTRTQYWFWIDSCKPDITYEKKNELKSVKCGRCRFKYFPTFFLGIFTVGCGLWVLRCVHRGRRMWNVNAHKNQRSLWWWYRYSLHGSGTSWKEDERVQANSRRKELCLF